jgi:hypothetical protein
MKTATKAVRPKTVQQWIELRRIELRKIEKQGNKSRPATTLSLVPRRGSRSPQLELRFGGPEEL